MKSFRMIQIIVSVMLNVVIIAAQDGDTVYPPQNGSINKSLIITIDPLTLNSIDTCLAAYINFLTREGYRVIRHRTSENTPMDLREYLKGRYEVSDPPLIGAVFIGSFPFPFSLVEHSDGKIAPYLSMEYYQDLDGSYIKTQFDGVDFAFDNHTGDVESEIWSSVIPLIGAPGSDSAMRKITRYFQKNFAFREKKMKDIKRGHGEPILGYKNMDVWRQQIDVYLKDRNYDLRGGNLTITRDNSRSNDEQYPDAKYTFENELFTANFDFVHIGGHGNYSLFTHTEPSITINIPWADTNNIRPLYLMDGSCSTGEFHSHAVGCLATSFLYNPRNNAVIYTAATEYSYGGYENAEGSWRNVFIGKLEEGFSFGDALLYNFKQQPVDLGGRARDAYTAPRILFGDGTLKLQEYMDYAGNDPPYILRQNGVILSKQAPFEITVDHFTIFDNDNNGDEISLSLSEGEHYSLSDNTIVPKGGYTGFLTIPVFPNDGIEDGQKFTAVALVDSTDTMTVCENGEAGDIINNLETAIINRMENDLPGRLYFFPNEKDTLVTETYNAFSLKIQARGTDVGEVVFKKRIIEKKEGYSGIGRIRKTSGVAISDISIASIGRQLSFQIDVGYPREMSLSLYDLTGRRAMRQSFFCQPGKGGLSVNLPGLSAGSYFLRLTGIHGRVIMQKIVVLQQIR